MSIFNAINTAIMIVPNMLWEVDLVKEEDSVLLT